MERTIYAGNNKIKLYYAEEADRELIYGMAFEEDAIWQAMFDDKDHFCWSEIRDEMGTVMEEGCGIYRDQESMQKAVDKIAELKERYKRIRVADRSSVFNTDVLYTVELGYILDVAQSIANSAIERKESRGAHQRLDYTERDDVNYLKHTLAYYNGDDAPRIEYSPVKITKSQPAKRVYGAEAEAAEAAAKAKEQANG